MIIDMEHMACDLSRVFRCRATCSPKKHLITVYNQCSDSCLFDLAGPSGPDGMPHVILWRPEAINCRVLLPSRDVEHVYPNSNVFYRLNDGIVLSYHTSCRARCEQQLGVGVELQRLLRSV